MVDAARCWSVLRVYRTAVGEVQALRGVDMAVPAGHLTALVGPSGSGKSSLLRILAGLDPVTGGRVDVAGTTITELDDAARRRFRRGRIGYVWQRPGDNLAPHLTVAQNLALAAAATGVRRPAVPAVLTEVGLAPALARRRTATLSGGEQQRLGVALARIGAPGLVLADEPTAELDRVSAEGVIDLLAATRDAGATVVVATHDPRVLRVCDHVVALHHGTVAGYGTGEASVAAIDGQGRVQLPPDALARFPDGRVQIEVDGDRVVLRRPR